MAVANTDQAFIGKLVFAAGSPECSACPAGNADCDANAMTAACEAYTSQPMSVSQQGCLAGQMWSSWFMKYPPREIAMYMFSFGFMWIAFALAPITLHRTMTAKSANAVRDALTILHLFPLTFFLPVILLGATAASVSPPTTFEGACLPSSQAPFNPGCPSAIWPHGSISSFPFIAFKLAEVSGFAAFITVLAIVSCCASLILRDRLQILWGAPIDTLDNISCQLLSVVHFGRSS